MRCTIVLEFQDDEVGHPQRIELMHLHRNMLSPSPGDVGLTLAEGKMLLMAAQQQLIDAQIERYCEEARTCRQCGRVRRLHDGKRSQVKTIFGDVNFCRDRWKACPCGADGVQYVSPLKDYLPDVSTAELRWLHARLGAMLPYRQAHDVLQLMLPIGNRHNHVTVRNHTVAVGASVQTEPPLRHAKDKIEVEAELGIDVGYIRQVKGRGTSTMAVVTAAVGPAGKSPRIWASARKRTKPLHDDMNKFLEDSGYGADAPVRVITDGAKDLKKVSQALPRAGRWILDWAHIGRMIHYVDQALSPLVFSRVPLSGPRFDLLHACNRLRSYIWTGQKHNWRRIGSELYNLIEGQDPSQGNYRDTATRLARSKLSSLLSYLEANHQSLIDYRRWQQQGRRISTGFVESTINRLIGRRMCKDQQMRWSREGAHCLLQVRAALLNGELESRARYRHPWVGNCRISWPWKIPSSHPF